MATISSATPPPSTVPYTLRGASEHPLRLAPLRRRPLAVSSRLYSSPPSSSGANGSLEDNSSSSSDSDHVLHSGLSPPPRAGRGAPVFVTLPADAVGPRTGRVSRIKAMGASFAALAKAGVEGVAVELWWGTVERHAPGAYDWAGYVQVVELASRYGLKVRAIMAFHQCGTGPGDRCWIPLPGWVLEEMDKDPDLAYADRFGRRNREYISLGCEVLPVLRGRSPIQVYSDFMRSFRDNFRDYLGVVVTEIQVGMGPAGELRYPSFPSEKLMLPSSKPEVGEFQCYDKYMLASLSACARIVGMSEWRNSDSLAASTSPQNLEQTGFFKSDNSWNTAYGRFFLKWYSEMLLLHGERLCMVTDAIFWGTGVKILGKVSGIYWRYVTTSHPSELTAGYYNTLTRDGYLPIVRMFGKYRMTLCCTGLDLRDAEVQGNVKSSPDGFLRRLVFAARMYNLPLSCENSLTRLDDTSLEQVIKSTRLYSGGAYQSSLSFNYVRMNRHLFESHNWTRFTRLVRHLSDARTFQAKLNLKRTESCRFSTSAEEFGRAFAYH